ncbi:MAG: serine/threonine-protein phosphatase [Actinobacteria bacterium]|nr:serine/threonine-protein phosphatase [Actinomycetota bacterium]
MSSRGAAAAILQGVPAHRVPDTIASEASRIAGAPVALYVPDIDGSCLRHLAGSTELPQRLEFAGAIGPEIPEERFNDLARALRSQLLGSVVLPLPVYGRTIAVFVVRRAPQRSLEEIAIEGAIALEVASRYTDVLEVARRGRRPTAAAEAQHDMLPPRVACVEGAEIAGTVLPAYEVGGDWFDHAENPDGAWLALADAVGKGAESTALSAIALGALRAARRDGDTIEGAALAMHQAIYDMDDEAAFVTGVIARWHRSSSRLSLITCGHSPPLLQRADGSLEELAGVPALPFGIFDRGRTFEVCSHTLLEGERLLIYSDGVTERRTADGGFFGNEGIAQTLAGATSRTAAGAVSAIERAVIGASPEPLRDDATILVLTPVPTA